MICSFTQQKFIYLLLNVVDMYLLYELLMYSVVIHNFQELYSICSYYKMLPYSLCYTIYPCNLFYT